MDKKTLKTYQITINSEAEEIASIKQMFDIIKVKEIRETRTLTQNRALHKFCTQQSDELENMSIPIYTVLTHRPETIWTMEMVKGIWRDIQFAEFGTKSTTKLKKVGQIETIHKVFTKLIAEATKGTAMTPPFPSIDNMREEF